MSNLQATWHPDAPCPDGDAEWVEWISGGMRERPSREEYVAKLTDEQRLVFEAIERALVEQDLLLSGEEQDSGHWSLSDGRCVGMSWRAWGDLMQAVRNKREGYLAFYSGDMSFWWKRWRATGDAKARTYLGSMVQL